MQYIYVVEVVDRDGEWIRTDEFESLTELRQTWKWAEPVRYSQVDDSGDSLEWTVWGGSK